MRPALHAYWQVVPVQVGVPVAVLHTSPQALQLAVVLSVVQMLPQITLGFWQMHEPPEHVGVG
jgi:hypothetical protein